MRGRRSTQFGFHVLDEYTPWLDANPDARASIARYLRFAFAVLERDLSGGGVPKRELTSDERALGLPDPARLVETFYGTVGRRDLAGARAPWLRRSEGVGGAVAGDEERMTSLRARRPQLRQPRHRPPARCARARLDDQMCRPRVHQPGELARSEPLHQRQRSPLRRAVGAAAPGAARRRSGMMDHG